MLADWLAFLLGQWPAAANHCSEELAVRVLGLLMDAWENGRGYYYLPGGWRDFEKAWDLQRLRLLPAVGPGQQDRPGGGWLEAWGQVMAEIEAERARNDEGFDILDAVRAEGRPDHNPAIEVSDRRGEFVGPQRQ